MSIRALALLLCLLAGTASAADLVLFSVAENDAFLSVGRPDGAGDKILWNSALELEDGTAAGRSAGYCIRLDAAGTNHCTLTVDHEGHGRMIIQGVEQPEPAPSIMVIVAGSGDYVGAAGEVTVRPVEDRARFRYDIDFQPD